MANKCTVFGVVMLLMASVACGDDDGGGGADAAPDGNANTTECGNGVMEGLEECERC